MSMWQQSAADGESRPLLPTVNAHTDTPSFGHTPLQSDSKHRSGAGGEHSPVGELRFDQHEPTTIHVMHYDNTPAKVRNAYFEQNGLIMFHTQPVEREAKDVQQLQYLRQVHSLARLETKKQMVMWVDVQVCVCLCVCVVAICGATV